MRFTHRSLVPMVLSVLLALPVLLRAQEPVPITGRVMNDAGLRVRLRDAGLGRAAQFTWARTARITLDVYRRVLEASS